VQLVDRRARYKAIEDYRKCPLIVYATSTRMNVNAMMAGDAVREFIDQLDALPADTKNVDVLVHSTGGDALAAWKLMSILPIRSPAGSESPSLRPRPHRRQPHRQELPTKSEK
jgi:hypothetical protein